MNQEEMEKDIGKWCLIKGLKHIKGVPFIDPYFFMIVGIRERKYLISFPNNSEHIFSISPSKISIQKRP